MKRIISLTTIVMFFVTAVVAAPYSDYDDESGPWELSLLGGLNSDGWLADIGIAYFPVKCLGIKLALGSAGEMEEIEYWGDDYYDSDYYTTRFKFSPAVVLRTPALCSWNSGYTSLHLFVEPGFTLSPGAKGSTNAKVACWDFKAGFLLKIGNAGVTLGYDVSNFALYSGFPNSAYSQPANDKYNTHSVFASVSYSF